MATAVVCLLIVLAAARGALWLTEAQEAKRRAEAEASIEYVDESGKPISKDRALARLKQLEATKKSESRSTSTTVLDTGSRGRRGVPGNLACQYYAQDGDALEVRAGTEIGRSIVGYIDRMKSYCPEGITVVYPDRSTDFIAP